MNGTILYINHKNGSGAIKGDDGERYNFAGKDLGYEISKWNPGSRVDFVVRDGEASEIYLDVEADIKPQKTKVAAALLAIFLGGFGIHKFYIGKNTAGVIMLVVFFLGLILFAIPSIIVSLIAFIEGIIYLIKSEEDFHEQYVSGKRSWF